MKRVFAATVAIIILSSALFCGCTKNVDGGLNLCVVIDAGHGGIDCGVSGAQTKVAESDINLAIAKELQQCFKNAGFRVVMTRTSSGGLYGLATSGFKKRDMQKRAEIIKKSNADLFISVHQNFFSSSARRGAQVFFAAGNADGKALANSIQQQLNNIGESGRTFTPLAGDYYLLNVATCPAVICECGFLSNAQDEKLLLDDDFRKKTAYAIFLGAINYLMNSESQ